MKKFTFHVYLNDNKTKIQKMSIPEAAGIVRSIVSQYTDTCHIFECEMYNNYHDGSDFRGKALNIELYGISDNEALEIIDELKKEFNQEKILLQTQTEIG